MATPRRNESTETPACLATRLDVMRYASSHASEIHALSLVLGGDPASSGLGRLIKNGENAFKSHMRRRTKSHNKYMRLFHLKRSTKRIKTQVPSSVSDVENATCPDIGRSGRTICRRLRRRNMLKMVSKGMALKVTDRVTLLESHVWHAKRFIMERKWGCALPKHLPGRQRHSRSILRWAKEATVMHDSSYNSILELSGTKSDIDSVLSLIGGPPMPAQCWSRDRDSRFFSTAFQEGSVIGKFMVHEVEAYPLQPIASAWVLWRPGSRQLWVGVHVSACEDTVRVISEAIQRRPTSHVQLTNRSGQINQIELMGATCLNVLTSVLHRDATAGSDQGQHLAWKLLEAARKLPIGAVLSLQVKDPRYAPLTSSHLIGWNSPIQSQQGQGQGQDEDVRWHKVARSGQVADCPSLWAPDSCERADAPWLVAERRHSAKLAVMQGQVAPSSWKWPDVKKCFVMLIKQEEGREGGSHGRWTLLIPRGWMQAFWVHLVMAGGRVIGQVERRWLATECGQPWFPDDFPDCPAYARHQWAHCLSARQAYDRKPKSKRPSGPPLPPDWTALLPADSSEKHRPVFDKLHSLHKQFSVKRCRHPTGSHGPQKAEDRCIGVHQALREGKLQWRKVEPPAPGGTCPLVRVEVRLPRKGVVLQDSILCAPTDDDFDKYCDKGLKWQGVTGGRHSFPPSTVLTQSQARKKNLQGKMVVEKLPADSGISSLRNVIGYVTSAPPKGSVHGVGVGFCHQTAFGVLLGRQYSNQKCNEVVALLRHTGSVLYRPVILTLPSPNRN